MPHKTPILIAEDDENDSVLLQMAIHKVGIANPVHIVSDGQAAIDFLEKADNKIHPIPAFLITDIKMPRKDGFDVLRWLQNHPKFAALPAIVWSSSRRIEDVEKAYQCGASTYFVKPTNFTALQKLISSIFEYWMNSENLLLRKSEDNGS